MATSAEQWRMLIPAWRVDMLDKFRTATVSTMEVTIDCFLDIDRQ